jgi:colanic acid/amylovoran biosynthesis glycosyltransferase
MNVAHFASPYLPETQTFIYNYLTHFRSCKSFVFAFEFKNLDQFAVENLNKIPKWSLARVACVTAEAVFKNKKMSSRWVFNLNNTSSLRSRLRELGVSLVHSHFGHMGCYNVNLVKGMGMPMVTTFYGWDISFLARIGWAERYLTLFETGSRFLVEGSHMKRCLAALGCPEDKIEIVHIGADVEKFRFRERIIEDGERVVFLFCGRFIEKKGLEYALRALALARKRHRNIEFRVIGDGSLRAHVMSLIEELELSDAVRMLGILPYVATQKEMENAHILVQPSVTAANGETEGGAPSVLIEAQAYGLPVLASFHADIPEVVLDKKSGLLSQERDFEQLADHMAFLVENRELWPKMGLAGRKHVERNYNIKNEADKIEKIYARLIK